MNQQLLVDNVVQEVLRRLAMNQSSSQPPQAKLSDGSGLFPDADSAVAAATRSQKQLAAKDLNVRDGICKLIKQMAKQNADAWGRMEYAETKVGRLEHKAAKLELLEKVPGVEFLRTTAHSGSAGIGLDEGAPWGVIGVITPVTHSVPTVSANAINMIAAGNAMVINAHPSGANCLATAVEAYNRAIKDKFGIDPLMCVIHPPTLRTAEAVFQHPDIPLLVATGGPAVARAAAKQPKRAIVAGPGNPPVVVDETADLDRAAYSIIFGGGFDNNLLCIGEKEVFVVESVFDRMMDAMKRAGAVRLDAGQIARLTEQALTKHGEHWVAQKDFVGKNPSVLAKAVGMSIDDKVELLFGETPAEHPFVTAEQMMPFMPFVRCRDFDQALAMALKYEHGFQHTALIHSNNFKNITRMGQAMNTTIFVVNGPCTAGLGIEGEGYPSYSIATPSGEGITNPLTFTRFRRMSISGALRMV
ncbi:MAG: aldehyde dehydrogenase EutE [Phycisphaeraceae bacterium]|nr:aldehyde dehydrogenase EutE [Phycisphaeraceae bacterium]